MTTEPVPAPIPTVTGESSEAIVKQRASMLRGESGLSPETVGSIQRVAGEPELEPGSPEALAEADRIDPR